MARSGKEKSPTPRSVALDVTAKVIDAIGCNVRVAICGSLRREKLTVGDVDLVVDSLLSFDKLLFSDMAIKSGLTDVECLTNEGDPRERRKMDYRINGVLFNVYAAESEAWGAMTLFLTGSKWFNIKMRKKAQEIGMKLNQYGLWRDGGLVAAKTENEIFKALLMKPVRPRDRD